MDYFDYAILNMLKRVRSVGLVSLWLKVGVSNDAVQAHLCRLIDQGLIVREKLAQKRLERTPFRYSLAPKAVNQGFNTNTTGRKIVTFCFSKLRHICRFEKSSLCKIARIYVLRKNSPNLTLKPLKTVSAHI